jgi:hypothetical protein
MNEHIRDAAAESIRAEDPRQRLHDVTLEALKARRFDGDAIREVVRAVAEGMARGAGGSRLGVRQALAEGFRGMDEALAKSVHVGEEALQTGRHTAKLMAEVALGGLELAGDIGKRSAHLAGGVLAGMADALDKKHDGKTGA